MLQPFNFVQNFKLLELIKKAFLKITSLSFKRINTCEQVFGKDVRLIINKYK